MKRILLGAAFSALLLASHLFGQAADGNIVGATLDASGAGVPDATITLENLLTGVRSATRTDSTGVYRFGNVAVGRYRVTASAVGFTITQLNEVGVELNKTSTANIMLPLGSLSTAIEVVDAPTIIDTTTGQVSNNYEARLAAETPVAANSAGGILNLALLGGGVTSSGGVGAGVGPSVGGQRPRNNNFSIEGADNNRKDVTGPAVSIPNDAVAELTVLQNQFSAEFGHSAGAQFNTVLRAGGNEVHGGVYEYLQNRNLNAIDQSFARLGFRQNPRYDYNRIGASIGGPIKRNKLFYYGLYEYNPLGQASTPSSTVSAPTAAGYAALAAIPGISTTNLDILKKYVSPAPTGTRTTIVSGVAIPIGVLPILAPNYTNRYAWLSSVDWTISERDQFRARYVDNRTSAISTAANLPVFYYPRPTTAKLASVAEFHNFNPRLVNELRLGYNRYNDDIQVPNFQFPGLDVFPNIQIVSDLNLQLGPNPSAPSATIQNTYQLVDNVSWTRGRHDFRFGFDGRSMIAATTFVQRVRGDYQYDVLQRFLLDQVPDRLAQRNVGGKPYSGNNHSLNGYVNDNWKAARNLSFNLGLRYEFTSVPRSMKEQTLNSLSDVPGVLTFFEPQPQKKNFAPRLGFGYSPGRSATTSIRGGFGLAYDQIFDNIGSNARPPQAAASYNEPVTDVPGFLARGGIKPGTPTTALTVTQARAQTSSWLPDQMLGYSINWNLGVQHVFARDYTLEARYIGTRGLHLLYQTMLNRTAVVTPAHSLPTYLSAPTQAQLDALSLTLAQLTTERDTIGNPMAKYGFTNFITTALPRGNSTYHGLALELNKRFSRGLLLRTAYTWSHLMDDSTAEINSTTLSPRRAQDFDNLRAEWASSALDRRHRLTVTWLYESQWLRSSRNWFARNILGNYQIAGTYTAESPEYATPQSGADSNLNGDSAGDRVILNVNGTPGLSSDVTVLKNSAGATVAYLAANPNAQFIRAQAGAFPTSGRNIMATNGINNFDVTLAKNLRFGERRRFQIRMDMFNALNHAQFTPGQVNNINASNRANVTNYLTPGNPFFRRFDQVYGSNARGLQLGAKFDF